MQLDDDTDGQGFDKVERNGPQRTAGPLADARRGFDQAQRQFEADKRRFEEEQKRFAEQMERQFLEDQKRFAAEMAHVREQRSKLRQLGWTAPAPAQGERSQPAQDNGARGVPRALRAVPSAVKSTAQALAAKGPASTVPPASAAVHPTQVAAQPSEQATGTAEGGVNKMDAPQQTRGPDIAPAKRVETSEQHAHAASARSAETEQPSISTPSGQPPAMSNLPAAPTYDVKPDSFAEALQRSYRADRAAFEASQATFQKEQAEVKRELAFLPLKRLLAGILWQEMKRRIIMLPDSMLATVIQSRDNFLAWISWVAEPAWMLSGR